MNQAIATRDPGDITGLVEEMAEGYSRAQIDLIKRTLVVVPSGMDPMSVTDLELALCFAQAKERRLSPLAKQCYFIKWTKSSQLECYPSWEGILKMALDTKDYDGHEGPYYSDDGKTWTEVWLEDAPPAAAKVMVWRKGFKVPIVGIATWKASRRTYPDGKLLPRWKDDAVNQLGKCALRLAVRRAFPLEVDDPLSGDQLKALHTLAALKGMRGDEGRPQRLQEAGRIVGREIGSFKELSRTEASEVFETWSDDVDSDVAEGEIVTAGEAETAEPREEEGGWNTDVAAGAGGTGLGEVPQPPAPVATHVTNLVPEQSTLDVLMTELEAVRAKRSQVSVDGWLQSWLDNEKLLGIEHADEDQAERGLSWLRAQFGARR